MARRVMFKRRRPNLARSAKRDNVGRIIRPQRGGSMNGPQQASSGWQGLPLPLNTDTPRRVDKTVQTMFDVGGGGLQAGMR
jgi:hypothetical protein